MHPTDEQIQRLLHGELDRATRAEMMEHLVTCASCADRHDLARREEQEAFTLLASIDHPAPRVDPMALVARAHRSASTVWIRRAAAVVVAVGLGTAAYAWPGSPLPAWLHKMAGRDSGEASRDPVTQDSVPDSVVTSGIAIPTRGAFVMSFTNEQAQGEIDLKFIDGDNVVVRVLGGTAVLTTEPHFLEIDNHGSSASYEIRIPNAADPIEIFVDDRSVFRRSGDLIIGRRTIRFALNSQDR